MSNGLEHLYTIAKRMCCFLVVKELKNWYSIAGDVPAGTDVEVAGDADAARRALYLETNEDIGQKQLSHCSLSFH